MNEPTELNLTILVGQITGGIKTYNDGGRPKVVFTVAQGQQRFYVEGLGDQVQAAAELSSGRRVLVMGHLFRRGNRVGLRTERIIPLDGDGLTFRP